MVLDGAARDLAELRDDDFPVFARGGFSRDSLISSNIVEVDGEVTIGGLTIRAGQVVLADADGVLAFDDELTDRVLELCADAMRREEVLRGLLSEGLSSLRSNVTYGHDVTSRWRAVSGPGQAGGRVWSRRVHGEGVR